MNLQNALLKGEEVVISDRKEFNAIGRTVVLEDCIVRIRVPARSLSIRGTFTNTTVVAETKLIDFQWFEVKLVNCAFCGQFKDNSFGTVPELDGYCTAGIFTEADLDDCTFYGDASDSHQYPTWPNFVVLHPLKHLEEMKQAQPRGRLQDVIGGMDLLDSDATAVTFSAMSLAARVGEDMDHIKAFFAQFPFVRM